MALLDAARGWLERLSLSPDDTHERVRGECGFSEEEIAAAPPVEFEDDGSEL